MKGKKHINTWTSCDCQRALSCQSKETKRKVPNSEKGNMLKRKKNAERKEAINLWTSMLERCRLFIVFSLSIYYPCTKY